MFKSTVIELAVSFVVVHFVLIDKLQIGIVKENSFVATFIVAGIIWLIDLGEKWLDYKTAKKVDELTTSQLPNNIESCIKK